MNNSNKKNGPEGADNSRNNYHNLKPQTPKNQYECEQMLRLAKLQHPDSVLVDATLENGKVTITVYSDDETLEKRAKEMLKLDAIREALLASPGGTAVWCLTSPERFHLWKSLDQALADNNIVVTE